MKLIFVIVLILGFNLAHAAEKDLPQTRTFRNELYGEPMFIESSAYHNWRGACRDFTNQKLGGRIIEVDCGIPKCREISLEIHCSSWSTKVIECGVSGCPKTDEPD